MWVIPFHTTTPLGVWGVVWNTRESFIRCGDLKVSVIGQRPDFNEASGHAFCVMAIDLDQCAARLPDF